MRIASKSEATKALRQMFGPTARIAVVDKLGIEGVRVMLGDKIVFQTFDLSGDIWRRCVRECLPLLRKAIA